MTVATTRGSAAAPRTFVGQVYGAEWGDVLVDLLEQIPDLLFPTSTRTYAQMRTYPQLRGVLASYCLPIERAKWSIDPAGCRDVVVQAVADDIGLPILGDDSKPGPARRRGVSYKRHLKASVRETLTYGFSPWEKRFEFVGGRFRLAELASRAPQSVASIEIVPKTGELKGIRQNIATDAANDLIKGQNLVWYVHEKEGANWAGRSLLRSAYGPWILAMEMWRVHGTSIQRFGMGVPGFEPKPGAVPTEGQLVEAQRIASKMRAGETSGYAAPAGFEFVLKGMTGTVPDALAFIRYLDQAMSAMALSGVMDLGSTPNGSRALGDVFMDLLLLAVQSVGDDHAEVATQEVSVSIVDAAFGEDEAAPRIVCGDVGADPEIEPTVVAALVQSGALSADPELESALRSKYGIPDRDPNAPAPAPSSAAPPAAAGIRRGRGRQPRDRGPVASVELRRQPTEFEVASKVDFAKVQNQWDDALDGLVDDWADISKAQRDEIVKQVRSIVAAGDVSALADMTVSTDDAADELHNAMVEVADDAAQQQADEADDQGVATEPGTVDDVRLRQIAVMLAALLGAGLVSSAARKALQVWTPEAAAADVGDAVRDHLDGLSPASLRDSLGAGLSAAQNQGRIATLQIAPAARYAASEILDANSCQACVDEDGHEFGSLSDAEAAYASGGFVDCQGGLRCRGIIVALWDSAALAA